jgi:hypothetical protein
MARWSKSLNGFGGHHVKKRKRQPVKAAVL